MRVVAIVMSSALAISCAQGASIQPMPAMLDLSHIRTYSNESVGPVDTLIEGVLDVPPTLMNVGPVHYPPDALKSGLQGWVVLEAIVGANGHVEHQSARLVAASDSVFIPAAKRWLMTCTYAPGQKQGQPVRALVRQPVSFNIEQRR